MQQYIDLVKKVLQEGINVTDRTGIGTRSVFGYQMRFDLSKGFPAVTTKRLAWKAVVGELLWFIEGSTDERRLAELTYGKDRSELIGKPTIWTANADAQGKSLGYTNNDLVKELGPVYGAQWRKFGGIEGGDRGKDQIVSLINDICTTPDSRRLILSAWNPNQIQKMALPPCHVMTQFRVVDGKLSCQLYQRSADIGLGVPFNIASYALLTHLIAIECNLQVGDFIHTIGDAHIYLNHISAMESLLERDPLPLPTLDIEPTFDFYSGLYSKYSNDSVHLFQLKNYVHHPEIRMEMAV
jgi:thymidylate synthase